MPKLSHSIMRDGSRCFLTLQPATGWMAFRDHVTRLEGAQITNFVTDGITEAWLDFDYAGYKFNVNDAPGDYWFFVNDPACPDVVLQAIADHFVTLERDR